MKSNHFPISTNNKGSKYTLAKRSKSKSKNQPNTQMNSLFKNINIPYSSNFIKFQSQNPISFTKHDSLSKGKNTLNPTQKQPKSNKTKKDVVSSNNDLLKFYKQLQLIKKTFIKTNRTICNDNSLDKNRKGYITSSYPSKRKNLSKQHSSNAKDNTIKINMNRNINKRKLTMNISQDVKSSSKKMNSNLSVPKQKKKDKKEKNNNNNSRKTFKSFNPFHIKFSKPLSYHYNKRGINGNLTTKNATIFTFQHNKKKMKSTDEKGNKSQEIGNKVINNSYVNKCNNQNYFKGVNNTSSIRNNNNNNKRNNYFLNCFNDNELIDYSLNQDENGEEINIYRTASVNSEDVEENSGVLAYDDVKDIIIYFDMDGIEPEDKCLFDSDEEEMFNKNRRSYYLQCFGLKGDDNNNNKENNNTELVDLEIYSCKKKANSPSTNASYKNKNTLVTVIKNES